MGHGEWLQHEVASACKYSDVLYLETKNLVFVYQNQGTVIFNLDWNK